MIQSPYAGYDVMAEADHWDERTRATIRARLERVPPIVFFSPEEAELLAAVAARVVPQDDRPPAQRVPIAPFIDQMLATGETDGYREPDMPWHEEMWRLGLAGIDEASQAMQERPFTELDDAARDAVLRAVQGGAPPGETWRRFPASKFFTQLVQQIAVVYYAHPAAWSEIGWGGPASPRGYVRTGMRDPWEARERAAASSVDIVRQAEGQEAARGTGGATH